MGQVAARRSFIWKLAPSYLRHRLCWDPCLRHAGAGKEAGKFLDIFVRGDRINIKIIELLFPC